MLVTSGCDARLHAVVGADERVTVDAQVWTTADDSMPIHCVNWDPPEGISCVETPHPSNPLLTGLRFSGTTTLEALEGSSVPSTLILGDQRFVFTAPAESYLWAVAAPGDRPDEPDQFSAEVTFPGPVTDADPLARVQGTTVSWHGLTSQNKASLHAVALRPDARTPRALVVPAAVLGALLGAAGMLVVVAARARRGGVPDPDVTTAEAAPSASDSGVEPPEDPSVWAPDGDR